MFKLFTKPTHVEQAQASLEDHRSELLVALEKLEYYEGYVAAKRKTIQRLEATYADKTSKVASNSISATSST